jgi:hypothetical protein
MEMISFFIFSVFVVVRAKQRRGEGIVKAGSANGGSPSAKSGGPYLVERKGHFVEGGFRGREKKR